MTATVGAPRWSPANCAHSDGVCACCQRGWCDCGGESQCSCGPCYVTDEEPTVPALGLDSLIHEACGKVATYPSVAGTFYAGPGDLCLGCQEPGRVEMQDGRPVWVAASESWEEPRPGDVLVMRDGKRRALFEITTEYGGWVGFTVQTKFGRPAVRRGSIKGWSETARVEVAKGGRYERAAR